MDSSATVFQVKVVSPEFCHNLTCLELVKLHSWILDLDRLGLHLAIHLHWKASMIMP